MRKGVTLDLGTAVNIPSGPMRGILFNVVATLAEIEAEFMRMHTREGEGMAIANAIHFGRLNVFLFLHAEGNLHDAMRIRYRTCGSLLSIGSDGHGLILPWNKNNSHHPARSIGLNVKFSHHRGSD